MATSKKIATAQVQFYFENDLTQIDYDKVQNRVQRYIDGTELETTASFFITNHDISVFITYDITNENEYKVFDYLGKRLTTLIDWHKQAATYGWDRASITQTAIAQKISA
jgi:hypothetical protein